MDVHAVGDGAHQEHKGRSMCICCMYPVQPCMLLTYENASFSRARPDLARVFTFYCLRLLVGLFSFKGGMGLSPGEVI